MQTEKRLFALACAWLCLSAAPVFAQSAPAAAQSAPVVTPASADQPATHLASPGLPQGLKPFSEVIKDAKRIEGFLRVWVKEDKFWIELREADFERPFYFATNRTQGLGERWMWSGLMDTAGIGLFRRQTDRVQWLQINTAFDAMRSPGMARTVRENFPDSLLAAAAIASQPHPETKAILIDASALLLIDFTAQGTRLEATYRQGYALDRGNSMVSQLRSTPDESGFELKLHFGIARQALAPPGQTTPPPPRNVPDMRSLLLGLHVGFSALPTPMQPRLADPRVGYFHTTRWDFSDDLSPTPRTRYIRRWRLEKKDPSAAMSAPVKPITFWIDRNVPVRYRQAVRDGILMWQPAFERIGYQGAIEVKQQPDDANWIAADRAHATVRWYIATDSGTAIGPHHSDPRTGEILDADILIAEARSRDVRQERAAHLPDFSSIAITHTHANGELCDYSDFALTDMLHSLDALAATGEVRPDSPEAEEFVQAHTRRLVAHEVGHALGLTHNFRGSSAYSAAQLRDAAFVARNGFSASIMDYIPTYVALPGESKPGNIQNTIGPYDFWAIEYGYRHFKADEEGAALAALARRGETDPALAYGPDLDADGIDPKIAGFDLGDDPRAYFERQLKLTRSTWDWASRQALGDAQRYAQPRDTVLRSLSMLAISAQNLTRQIGGLHIDRRLSVIDRAPLTPVSLADQRAALDSLASGLFAPGSLSLSPRLLSRLVPDYLDRWDGFSSSGAQSNPQLPLLTVVSNVQQQIIERLLSDATAQRMLEAQLLVGSSNTLSLTEMHTRLRRAIWAELEPGAKASQDISVDRRQLQRAHLSIAGRSLLRPNATMPADARNIVLAQAHLLRRDVARALLRKNWSDDARIHLENTLASIDDALRATVVKNS